MIAVGQTGSTSLQYIPVSLTTGTDGGATGLSTSPTSLSFTQTPGQPAPDGQQLEVSSASRKDFTVSAATSSGGNWLLVSSAAGSTPYLLVASVASADLSPGKYSGTITITPSGSTSGLVVPVSLTVGSTTTTAPLTASPTKLSFSATAGGSNPATQTVQVSSTSATPVNFSAAASVTQGTGWLQVTPGTGQTPGSLQVTANVSGLAAGTYNGNIVVTPAGASSGVTIPVTLTVSGPPTSGQLTVSPTTLTFTAKAGGSNPATQTLQVSGPTGGSAVSYTTSATVTQGAANWLQVTPTSGQTPGTLTVTANVASLTAGTYTGTITITPASGTALTVTVTFTVT